MGQWPAEQGVINRRQDETALQDDRSEVISAVQQDDIKLDILGRQLNARWLRHKRPASPEPVLVLLHEALGCIAMWKDLPAVLAQLTGCDLLVYERFGHGHSAPLPEAASGGDYLTYEAWQVLPELLRQCGIERPLLIGHSDGGTLALMYAARFPQQVAGVVSEAAHLFVDELSLAGIRAAKRTFKETRLLERLAKYHADPEPIFRRWTEIWLTPEFAVWSIEDLLAQIDCPLLAIQGEEDEYGTSRQVEALVAGVSGPAQALLIPECQHIPHFQAQQTFLEAVSAFVAARDEDLGA